MGSEPGCDPSARGQNHRLRQQSADRCRTTVFTDMEMLAVVFGVEHFHLYLYGSNFTVYTDHKPLLGIYRSQKSATTRTERWRLRLTPYDMTLKYRPGRNDLNPADYVSRQPQDIPKRENAAEAYVNYVCKNAIPKSITLEEVRKETQKDFTMRKLAKAIQTGQWTKDPTDYVRFKDELSVSCGVILLDHRLIIPDSLRKKVIEIAHASHQGIVKTKQLIREKVWFPGIDKKVEQKICIFLCSASLLSPQAFLVLLEDCCRVLLESSRKRLCHLTSFGRLECQIVSLIWCFGISRQLHSLQTTNACNVEYQRV